MRLLVTLVVFLTLNGAPSNSLPDCTKKGPLTTVCYILTSVYDQNGALYTTLSEDRTMRHCIQNLNDEL
ncbi:hypothetical protein Q1695_004375 [Nippostrongylus brasiliensis]|nr:hypothetical protein Q1695_004375 [Nippostrongylus brasiliensis]